MTHATMIKLMRGTRLYDAPEYVLQRAIGLFSQKSDAPGPFIKAILSFDSWMLPELVGVRSHERSARQLVYKTDSFHIYIMLLQGHHGRVVLGQVVSVDPIVQVSDRLVALRSNSRIVSRERTNAAGEFVLTAGDRGTYRKHFHLIIYAEQPILVDLTN